MTMAQNEALAAVGGNDDGSCVVLDGDNIANSIIGRRYEDHPQYQDLVVALNSRKKHLKLAEKKVILKLFRPSELGIAGVEKFCCVFWSGYGIHSIFESIRINTTTESQINKLTTTFVAEKLADLFVLNDWITELPPEGRRLRDDPTTKSKKAFASLKKFVVTIMKKYLELRC